MIVFLIFCSFLIPLNLWAAITPHIHSDLSMRILHGVCTVVLVPLLWALWRKRKFLQPVFTLILAIFCVVMLTVNAWITAMGMDVEMGWLDHLFLALSEISVVTFFLLAPEPVGD